jgi:hypothetical protein
LARIESFSAPPPAHFSAPELHQARQTDLPRALGECIAAHQRGTRPRELPFAPLGVRCKERVTNHEAQYSIPQELEPLVPAVAARLVCIGRVRERGEQLVVVAELVAERARELGDRIGCGGRVDRRTLLGRHAAAPAIQPPPSTTSPS